VQYFDNAKKHELNVAESSKYFLIFRQREIYFQV